MKRSITLAAARRSLAGKATVVSLLAAFLLALPGFALPANAVGAGAAAVQTARADVVMTANAFQLVFAGEPAQIAGTVLPAVATTKIPTGTVALLPAVGDTPLDTAQVDTGSAFRGIFVVFSPPLSLGTHVFRAAYSGDGNFAPKTIQFSVQSISGPATKTVLTVSPAGTSALGQIVTATAQVAAPTGPLTGVPVGGVTLLIDGAVVTSKVVGSGWKAVFTISGMSPGRHVITAEYSNGNNDYFSSVSPPVTHTVAGAVPAAIRTEFHSSRHGTIPPGQAVTVQAIIASRVVGGATPTGWVQFYDWNTKVGAPVKMVNGQASFKYVSLKPGKHVLQAEYLGSTAYAAGFTPARTVTVTAT